ncbi:MAG: hypothetical protein IPI58_09320 [Alphaproteobacteria bacterium]|nr:MAG: hypothetical protein IPI58_09320 [Alphaproteobacteria bacterium]
MMGKKDTPKKSSARTGRSGKGMAGFSLLAILGLSVALFPPVSMFAMSLIPGACALLASRKMGRGLPFSVMVMSLAGSLPVVAMMIHKDTSWSAVMAALGKPYPWVCVFGAAALAWFIHGFLPLMVASLSAQHYQMRRASMRKCLENLKEEWGADVEGNEEEEKKEA